MRARSRCRETPVCRTHSDAGFTVKGSTIARSHACTHKQTNTEHSQCSQCRNFPFSPASPSRPISSLEVRALFAFTRTVVWSLLASSPGNPCSGNPKRPVPLRAPVATFLPLPLPKVLVVVTVLIVVMVMVVAVVVVVVRVPSSNPTNCRL